MGINKAIVEFLRVNTWIKRWFDIDYSKFTLKEGGYNHLPLDYKKEILNKIKIPNVSVCEDYTDHYIYWRDNFNPNKNDCCNLRKEQQYVYKCQCCEEEFEKPEIINGEKVCPKCYSGDIIGGEE